MQVVRAAISYQNFKQLMSNTTPEEQEVYVRSLQVELPQWYHSMGEPNKYFLV